MNKKEKLKEFHRSNIIEVAKKLFIEKGVIQTSMDEIAKEADYSKSTLYAYFKSKDEIYSYIVYENTLLLKQAIVDAIKNNETLEAAFMAICEAHVSFYDNYPLYFESMIVSITEAQDDSSPIYRMVFELGEEINKVIMDFLDKRIKMKQVRPDIDTLQTAFALWAGICGLIIMTNNKSSYIDCMKVSKQDFLSYGFKTYLNSILI